MLAPHRERAGGFDPLADEPRPGVRHIYHDDPIEALIVKTSTEKRRDAPVDAGHGQGAGRGPTDRQPDLPRNSTGCRASRPCGDQEDALIDIAVEIQNERAASGRV